MARQRRTADTAVLKVSFLVESREFPDLFRWLTSLPSGHMSRLVRERLERTLAAQTTGAGAPRHGLAPTSVWTPAAAPAVRTAETAAETAKPSPQPELADHGGLEGGDGRAAEQILLDMERNF